MKYATKTNNKTLLLALVAVFAMIAAGAAVVMASEDTDATAVPIPGETSKYKIDGKDVNAYKIAIVDDGANELTTTAADQIFVITGADTTKVLTVTVSHDGCIFYILGAATGQVIFAEGEKAFEAITIVAEDDVAGYEAVYTTVEDLSMKVADEDLNIGVSDEGYITLTSTAACAVTLQDSAIITSPATFTLGDANVTLGVAKDKVFVYYADVYPDKAAQFASAFFYDASEDGMAVYGTQPENVAMAVGDFFKPTASGVTISTGANTVTVDKYKTNNYTGDLVFSAAGEPVVLSAANTFTKGEVKVTLGSVTFAAAQAADATHVVTGIATTAAIGAAGVVYSDVAGLAVPAFVHGNYWFPNKTTKLDVDVTVIAGATLTILENQTVDVGVNKSASAVDDERVLTINGTVDVWGKLNGVTGKNSAVEPLVVIPEIAGAGTLTIRADAVLTGFVADGDTTITTATVQEVPASDDYPGISGTLDKDAEYANFEIPNEKSLTIPEGVTLTVTNMMALNGRVVYVNGTLVIADGAQVGGKGAATAAANAIILGAKGKITGDGDVAKYTPVYVGTADTGITVIGVEGITASISSGKIAISGAASPIDNANFSYMDIKGGFIADSLTIDEGVEAALAADVILKKGTLLVSGVLDLKTFNITMKDKTAIGVLGYIMTDTGVIKAEATLLGEDLPKATTTIATFSTFKPTASNDDAGTPVAHYPTGYAISVVKTDYKDDEGNDMYFQRAYLSGELTYTGTLGTGVHLDTAGGLAITNAVFVAALDELEQSNEKMAVTTAAPTDFLVVEGTFTSVGDFEICHVIGAAYTITTTEPATTTKYVVDFNTGLFGDIDSYKNKTVSLYGKATYPVDLAADLTITDKQVVEFEGAALDKFLTIPEGVVLAVMAGGSFDGAAIADINGKVIVFKDGSCDLAADLYEVYFEDDDGDATYCGLATALAEAEAGDTITVTKDVTETSFTIPEGITVVISPLKTLTVKKAITVSKDAVLEINGNLAFGTATMKNAKINVLGTMDISAAQGVVWNDNPESHIQIASEGEFIYTTDVPAGIVLVGVTYKDGTKTILTNIDNAVESGKDIAISGTYETDEDIELGESNLVITGDAKIAGISLEGGSVTVTGTLTGTISGIVDEEGAASVSVVDFTGIIANPKADGKYTVNASLYTAGSVVVLSGTLVLATEATVDAECTLTVAESAVLMVNDAGIELFNEGAVIIAGDLILAKNASLEIDNIVEASTLLITGNVYVSEDATLEVDDAAVTGNVIVAGAIEFREDVFILGTVSVDNSEGSTATAKFDGNTVVGTSDIGAAAGIYGPITIAAGKFLAVYPGAEVGDDTVKNLKASEFYLNEKLYVTAYASTANVVAIGNVIDEVIPIAGYDMSGMVDFENWTNALGMPITADTNKIGATLVFNFDGLQKTADVLVSVATGMSIYVDGVKYASGTTIEGVSMGAHTVMVTVNPGYKYADGTGPTVTFDGKVLSGILAFTITPDMADKTVVLSAIGDIVVDQPDIPEQEKEDNSMIMILLGVLVVMVVILAIVTVIRMMRS